MNDSMPIWIEIISSSVVPVVIISACGLLCLAFYNRLTAVIARLRSLQRERLAEYREVFRFEEKKKDEATLKEAEHYLHFLENQTIDVLKRARYLRNTLFCLIAAISSFVMTSVLIGVSFFYSIFDVAVLFFFVLGLGLIIYGLWFAIKEIRISLDPIKMESDFMQKLLKSDIGKRY